VVLLLRGEARGDADVAVDMDAGLDHFRGIGRFVRVALGFGVLALLGCGKGARGECLALDSCGGNPSGSWKVTSAANSCQIPVVRPTQPVDVTDFTSHTSGPQGPTIAPPQANPVVLQQTTSGDWCLSLVLNPDDTVSNANLWHEAPELIDGTFKLFDADHSYTTSLTFSTKNFPVESNTTHFAPRCLLASGGGHPDPKTALPGPGTCDALGAGLTTFYDAGRVNKTVPPNFLGVDGGAIKCTLTADGGCDCVAAYTVQVDDAGTWSLPAGEPGTLLQDSSVFTYNAVISSSQAPAMSMRSTYCAQNNQLQLTGPRGGSLFTIQGLRTLLLTPM
jgi:hypothetical protein